MRCQKRWWNWFQNKRVFWVFESAREDLGITVSYWRDEASILKWKSNPEHQKAQKQGKELWYKHYKIRIAKVERDYGF